MLSFSFNEEASLCFSFFQTDHRQVSKLEESFVELKREDLTDDENESDGNGSDPIRDPGVEEEVWQELQLAIMREELEKERIKQEEEEARRYCLLVNILPKKYECLDR